MSAWIPLMDYAIKKGVSISTLRRYIKSNKIKYRTEAGKYLLWDDEAGSQFIAGPDDPYAPLAAASATSVSTLPSRIHSSHPASNYDGPVDHALAELGLNANPGLGSNRERTLERALQQAQEEIAELKMLVALYEEKLSPTASPAKQRAL